MKEWTIRAPAFIRSMKDWTTGAPLFNFSMAPLLTFSMKGTARSSALHFLNGGVDDEGSALHLLNEGNGGKFPLHFLN